MSDALRLFFPAEAEHRMKAEGVAQPFRLHVHDVQVERLLGGGTAAALTIANDNLGEEGTRDLLAYLTAPGPPR